MQIDVEVGDIARWEDEAIVVNLFEGVTTPGGATGAVDRALGGALSALIESGDVKGTFGHIASVPTLGRIPAKRVFVVGLGERGAFSVDRIREVAAKAAVHARDLGIATFSTIVHGAGVGGVDVAAAAEAVAEGTLLAVYAFEEHKTKPDGKRVGVMTIVTKDRAKIRSIRKSVQTAAITTASVNFVRDLVNAPSNAKTPTIIAAKVEVAAREARVKCTVFDEKELAKRGFGAVLGVAKGSEQPPRFVQLEYRRGGKSKPIVLVGKGITFDTGGISLKPQEGPLGPMWHMKYDMTGAAVAIGATLAAARLRLPVSVIALAPFTENMPGGNAQKPGDIVTSYGGKTIEVINTDAEGRLVLADALGYAREFKPQAVVDLATLTGACKIALGKMAAGMFSTDDKLATRLERAGRATDERVWRLPLWEEYGTQIESDVADVKNTGGRSAGAITAAKFLEKFADGTPWAHLDLAGVAWVDGGPETPKKEYFPKGSSGFGVRLLVRMLRDWKA